MERELGYYWVSNNGEWLIAEWVTTCFGEGWFCSQFGERRIIKT